MAREIPPSSASAGRAATADGSRPARTSPGVGRVRAFLTPRLQLLLVLLIGLTPLTWLAGTYWWADLLTHLVPYYTVAGLILGLALMGLRRPGWAVPAILIGLYHGTGLLPSPPAGATTEGAGDSLRVLEFNVRRDNAQRALADDWIWRQAREVDILVLIEVSDEWSGLLDRLATTHPWQRRALRGDNFGLAVASRLPARLELTRPAGDDIPAIIVEGRTAVHGVPFRLVAGHPPPPLGRLLTTIRDRQLSALAALAAAGPKARVLTGDLNLTPWSPRFGEFLTRSGLRDPLASRPYRGGTWTLGFLPIYAALPIDHTLVSPAVGLVERSLGPALGSDHRPVRLRLELQRD